MVPVAWDVTERQPAKSGNEHRQLHSLLEVPDHRRLVRGI